MVPATLVDILGQSGLANGLGMSSAVQGISNALVLPVAGEMSTLLWLFIENDGHLGRHLEFLKLLKGDNISSSSF